MNKQFTFFICDFETTGLDPRKDYPIEIGGLFLDSGFSILGVYQSFIGFPELSRRILSNENEWPEEYVEAYQFHKIEARTIIGKPESLEERLIDLRPSLIVAEDLTGLCSVFNKGPKKVIIISDNAQFEYWFMMRIFDDAQVEFPFHYCAWDTSMLLELSEIESSKDYNHRSLNDVGKLYQRLLRARERLNLF